jgi:hypothetical protein
VTFVLTVKVGDGIVIAADSTSTMQTQDLDNHVFDANYYRNANKIFNLVKEVPLAVCTYGLGAINHHSIEFTLKGLRRRLSGEVPEYQHWQVDPNNFVIQDVVNHFRTYIIDECYEPYFEQSGRSRATLGFILAGISSDHTLGQVYTIATEGGTAKWATEEVSTVRNTSTFHMAGQPEPVQRLLNGISPSATTALTKYGLELRAAETVVGIIRESAEQPLIQPQMPIQDAIDLSEFLVDVAVKWARFSPMGETIGGNIDIAALTKYEAFKWVKRKHFYSDKYNP